MNKSRFRVARKPLPAPARRALPDWEATEQLAAFLEVNLRTLQDEIDKQRADEADLRGMSSAARKFSPSPIEEHEQQRTGEPKKYTPRVYDYSDDSRPMWGTLIRFTEPQRPLKLPPWKLQRYKRAVEEGSIPKNMHRWPTDRKIFDRTRRIPGGSVLIDDSGSMNLTQKQLNDIVEGAPAAIVASYAGTSRMQDEHGKAIMDENDHAVPGGEIRILAKEASRVAHKDLEIDMGNNMIDGPALEWLAEQPYPRVWVSDGVATGPRANFDELQEICSRRMNDFVVTSHGY